MNRTYHTDLDRDDFAPGELLPWQDMSRHCQSLEQGMQANTTSILLLNERILSLEKALQTTTDSLRQAHLSIKHLQTHTIRSEEKIDVLEEEVDPEQAAEMRSWERANTRFENLPEQGGEYPIYNRAYVDRQFRDGELEY